MKARLFPAVMIPLLVLLFSAWAVAGTAHGKPRLVLQITIDQMRGDFPMRYKDRLGEGGFRYLMEKGTHYINTHYQHADTETPIGHAALFTGTYPAHNGIVAGNWFDIDKRRVIYNCEDDRYPLIGKEPAKGKERSGHVHVIADQFWYFYYEMETTTEIAAIHCSPWTYDTYVPLFFAGHGIPAQRIVRHVTPYDIAATIATCLEIKPPSGSVGIPLVEVLKGK